MILTIFQSDFAESEESISSCKKREGELLEFTQRLTETNATLQVGYLPLPFVPHLTLNIKSNCVLGPTEVKGEIYLTQELTMTRRGHRRALSSSQRA